MRCSGLVSVQSCVNYRVITCMYLNLDFSRASHFLVSQESMYITQNFLLCSYIHHLHMGVFPHECIILWVVKTTSLSMLLHLQCVPYLYLHFHFVSKIYLLHSKVTSTCTLISRTQYMCKISIHCSKRSCTCTEHLSCQRKKDDKECASNITQRKLFTHSNIQLEI